MKNKIEEIFNIVWKPIQQFFTFLANPNSFHEKEISRNFGVSITFLCIAAAGERFASAKKAEAISLFLTGDSASPAFFSWINYPVTGELFLIVLTILYVTAWYPAILIWKGSAAEVDSENTTNLIITFSAIAFFSSFLVQIPFIVASETGSGSHSDLFRFSRQTQLASGGVKAFIFLFAIINIRRMNHSVTFLRFWLGFLIFIFAWALVLFVYMKVFFAFLPNASLSTNVDPEKAKLERVEALPPEERFLQWKSACASQTEDDRKQYECLRYGEAYLTGVGTQIDAEAARGIFTDICRISGEPLEGLPDGQEIIAGKACYQLGEIYREGVGVPNDLLTSAKLHKMACEKNYLDSCATSGNLHGVLGNIAQALEVLNIGCNQNHSLSCSVLQRLDRQKGG